MRTTETISKLLEHHAGVILPAVKYSPDELRSITRSASLNKAHLTLVFGKEFTDFFITELAAIGGEYLCIDLSKD